MLCNIRKDPLLEAEVKSPGNRQQERDRKAGENVTPRHRIRPQQSRPEPLDNADKGIQPIRPPVLCRDETGRVDDRGRVHQELHQKSDGVFHIPVLDGEGGEPRSDPRGREHHDQNQERQVKHAPCRLNLEEEEQGEQEHEGNGEIEKFCEHRRKGENKARKVDFADHVGLGDETVGALRHRVGKIRPRDQCRETEDGIGRTVGLDVGQPAEDDRENDHGEKGLNDGPAYAERGLGIADFDTPPDQEVKEIAVLDHLLPVDELPSFFSFNDDRFCLHFNSNLIISSFLQL